MKSPNDVLRRPRSAPPSNNAAGTQKTSRTTTFWALGAAIMRGFLRDKAAVFFAIVFPLMFLVLFGGIFSDQDQSKVDLIDALKEVRKGDADVAVEQRGDTLIAHYTQTEQVKAAITQGTLRAFVDGANVAASGQPPKYEFHAERVEDDSLSTIQFFTPGLLGWAVAMAPASVPPRPCRAGGSPSCCAGSSCPRSPPA